MSLVAYDHTVVRAERERIRLRCAIGKSRSHGAIARTAERTQRRRQIVGQNDAAREQRPHCRTQGARVVNIGTVRRKQQRSDPESRRGTYHRTEISRIAQ